MVGATPAAPSGMLLGTGSKAATFQDTLLGSPLYPTWHAFASRSGVGFTAQLEHLTLSGDIITGSMVSEIGMNATSGGNLFFRSVLPSVELFGSVQIDSFLTIIVR